jgi:hypothetical protein
LNRIGGDIKDAKERVLGGLAPVVSSSMVV